MSSAAGIDLSNKQFVADLLLRGLFPTSGALAGHFFQIISPVGGAVFGSAVFFSVPFVGRGIDEFFGDSTPERIVKCIGALFLSAVAGTALVTYGLGISLSMVNAVYLTGAIVITSGITAFVLDSILDSIQDRFQ